LVLAVGFVSPLGKSQNDFEAYIPSLVRDAGLNFTFGGVRIIIGGAYAEVAESADA
jgi:hypothetical protein